MVHFAYLHNMAELNSKDGIHRLENFLAIMLCRMVVSAAALTGLAPIAHDSGAKRGKRAIADWRCLLRHVIFQAALVASHHNPVLKVSADRLRTTGKSHKIVITAATRKLANIGDALCRSGPSWTIQPV